MKRLMSCVVLLSACSGDTTDTSALEARIDELEAQVTSMQAELDAIEPPDDLSDELAALEARVSTAEGDIDDASAEIVTLSGTLDMASMDLAGLADELELSKARAVESELSASVVISGPHTAALHPLGTIAVDPPGPGRLIVTLTAWGAFSGPDRSVIVGIGDTDTAIDTGVPFGLLSGAAGTSVAEPVAATAVYATDGAATTFYGLIQTNPTFDSSTVNLQAERFTVIYVPAAL